MGDLEALNPARLLAHHIDMRVLIPTPLRPYAGKQAAVELAGTTVGEALSALTSQHPDLRRHLFTEEGKLRSFVNLYVNDEDIRYLQRENTPLNDADTLAIVPSVAGGCDCSCPNSCACCCC